MTVGTVREYHTESDVKNHVKQLLTKHGWMWWMPPANGFGKSNVDFNALRHGAFLAIETKYGTNKPTVMQQQYLRDVLAQDGHSVVVSDRTIQTFARWLELHDTTTTATTMPPDSAAWLDVLSVLTAPLRTQRVPKK